MGSVTRRHLNVDARLLSRATSSRVFTCSPRLPTAQNTTHQRPPPVCMQGHQVSWDRPAVLLLTLSLTDGTCDVFGKYAPGFQHCKATRGGLTSPDGMAAATGGG
jgi:hypothetical protein